MVRLRPPDTISGRTTGAFRFLSLATSQLPLFCPLEILRFAPLLESRRHLSFRGETPAFELFRGLRLAAGEEMLLQQDLQPDLQGRNRSNQVGPR